MPYRRDQIIRRTNTERRRHGLQILTKNRWLMLSAAAKAKQLARSGRFAHGRWWELIEKFAKNRIDPAGENIARDQDTPRIVMEQWMDSPGHKANILNKSFQLIGVGFAKDKNGREYWVQHFGYRKD